MPNDVLGPSGETRCVRATWVARPRAELDPSPVAPQGATRNYHESLTQWGALPHRASSRRGRSDAHPRASIISTPSRKERHLGPSAILKFVFTFRVRRRPSLSRAGRRASFFGRFYLFDKAPSSFKRSIFFSLPRLYPPAFPSPRITR